MNKYEAIFNKVSTEISNLKNEYKMICIEKENDDSDQNNIFNKKFQVQNKLIVTIIGDYDSNKKEIIACKNILENGGCIVNCQCYDSKDELKFIEKEKILFRAIEEADLIIAIPKKVTMNNKKWEIEFEESTHHEMSFAFYKGKRVIFW